MKQQRKHLTIAAASLLGAAAFAGTTWAVDAPPAENGKGGVQAGFLTCNVDSGWGFIVGSSRKLRCVWEPTKGTAYNYYGEVSQFGADVGYHRSSVLLWEVVDATGSKGADSLVGTYGGATAQASVGVGAGASALIGGFKHSVTLQPLAISGETGLNAAAGIQSMTLKLAKESATAAGQP